MIIYNKIFFLHIPKTAGSSFNAMFEEFPIADRYYVHMESRSTLFEEVRKEDRSFYLSGHFTFAASQTLIQRNDVFSITILRNPVQHLLSHIKWVKAYGDPENFNRRANLPAGIAELSKTLWNISLNDVESIKRLLESPTGVLLFDNLQTRYMTNSDATMVDGDKTSIALKNVEEFDLIFIVDDMAAAVQLLGKKFTNLLPMRTINKALIDEDVDLDDKKVLNFYRNAVAHDARLFSYVRDYSRKRFFTDMLRDD